MLERIPLQASAISIETLGKWKTNSSRKYGVPLSAKSVDTACADPFFSPATASASAGSGMGAVNRRNRSGNSARRNAVVPKNARNAPIHDTTSPNTDALRAVPSSNGSHWNLTAAVRATPARSTTDAHASGKSWGGEYPLAIPPNEHDHHERNQHDV